jgi:hypothetical protein
VDVSSIFRRENLGSSRRSGLINFPAFVAVVFCSPTFEGKFVYFTDCGAGVWSWFPVAIMPELFCFGILLPMTEWWC